jgi:hypothetical protein
MPSSAPCPCLRRASQWPASSTSYAREIGKESNVLYAHLGGQPALNAYSALFRNYFDLKKSEG